MARQTEKLIISIPHNQTSGVSQLVSLNQRVHQGLIFFIKIKLPNYTNNVTTALSILDKEGDAIYKISESFNSLEANGGGVFGQKERLCSLQSLPVMSF